MHCFEEVDVAFDDLRCEIETGNAIDQNDSRNVAGSELIDVGGDFGHCHRPADEHDGLEMQLFNYGFDIACL